MNDAEVANKLIAVARELYPENTLMMSRPVMGGEDFAWYLQEKPGAFFLLANPKEVDGKLWPQHSNHFALDESQFHKGIEVMVAFTAKELA